MISKKNNFYINKNRVFFSGCFLSMYLLSLTIKNSLLFNENLFEFRFCILILAAIVSFFDNQEKTIKVNFFLILFIAISCINALFFSSFESINYNLYYLVKWSLVYIIISELTTDLNGYKLIYYTLIGMVGSICFQLLYQVWLSPTASATEWILSANIPIILVPNDLILIASLSPVLCWSIRENSAILIKYLIIALLLLSLTLCVLYDSRSSVVIYLATVILFFYYLKQSIKSIILPFLFLLLVIVFLDAMNQFELWEKLNIISLQNRKVLWWTTWQMFTNAPFLGQGAGSFLEHYEFYKNNVQLPEGISIIDIRPMPWAHNLYLELLAERGGFSLMLFLLMVSQCFFKLTENIKSVNLNDRYQSIVLIPILIGMLLAGLVELTLTHYWVGLLFSIILAIASNPICNLENPTHVQTQTD